MAIVGPIEINLHYEMPTHKKRRAVLPISMSLLMGMGPMSRPGLVVEIDSNDIPADASVIGSSYRWDTDQLVLLLESDSFPESEDGDALPVLTGPVYRVRELEQPRGREFI